ncbi:DNA polymerase IF1 subunit beta [Gloeomargarita lithophora Alchichica-D10]|uniref:Beta sliding clamp n=1 Tax=Gloeomargarita lithophora Alchichica-D10 TaxID=1188229 RepID=A0A1J0ADK1_9CYAN|nr:DNA polymerase III subunit beta [Gloeomargarita lithophora]APB33987.1 DNA polymerase IF1 subunit beta [Gloeomargarita lithophora Alchichica-D10]
MYVTCSQKDLSNHLSMVSRAVANRPTNPILANVLFSADGNQVILSAFDQTLCLQSQMAATVYESGTITLPARTLGDLVSRLPTAEVEIKIADLQATLRARLEREGKKDTLAGPYQISGLPGEDFPALPEVTATAVPLEREAFLQGLKGVLFAASSDETKQILTGVHLQTRGETLEFAATDGHRLAIVETELTSLGEPVQATIPARALREVERLLPKYEGEVVRFALEPHQADFQLPVVAGEGFHQRLVTRLLDGMYPNYRQLLPKDFARRVVMEREDLIHALERLAVLAGSRNVVKFSLDLDNVILATEGGELGQGQEQIPAEIEGEALDVAFNVKYVLEGLKAMQSSQVQMQLNSATAPVIFSPLGELKMTYLVMPIQLRG